jgi:hypothetical protein
MKPYMTKIFGFDVLGAKTLAYLSVTWTSNTIATYGRTFRRYFDFFDEHRLAPLVAKLVDMARYVIWLGHLGTIKASSMPPCMSTVNGGFFKDHGLEAVILGDLVAKVRNGFATSHAAVDDTLLRVQLPASVVFQALRMA